MNTVSIDMLGSIFTEALIEVISKISGFSLEVLSMEHDSDFDDSVALMCLNSNKGGVLFISAEESDIRVISSFAEGVSEDDITRADIDDMLCELVNMTAGNAKLLLNDTDYIFTLSPPFVINGKDMTISTKKRVNVISGVVGNDEVSVRLKVMFY